MKAPDESGERVMREGCACELRMCEDKYADKEGCVPSTKKMALHRWAEFSCSEGSLAM
jgi:hypothetical protein